MLEKILLFPFGGNGREALLCILAVNARKKKWRVLGFIDDDSSTYGKSCCGVKVLGGRKVLKKETAVRILAVPGNPGNYLERKKIIESLGIKKSGFATVIHPSANISPDSVIGYNTLIMPNVVISCGARIGNHCVILPNTVISHDSAIGDWCMIGSNVSVSGNVRIEPFCYVGSGSKIRDRISIEKGSLVGLGSNVVSDIEKYTVAAGNPARAMRKIRP
ncbi:MAG: acetyltransferase [Candidatus Omnitrophica bacterium]|nr:acetyltransferase [Candidatus Omnitrophota bacterium]